jgi:sugar phosphate isomerase/epimerase
MSKILLSTGNLVYRMSLEAIGKVAAACGVDGLEVVINCRVVDEYEKYGKTLFELKSLPVLSLHAPYHVTGDWGTLRKELLNTIRIAIEEGIPEVTFHPPLNPFLQPEFWYFFNRVEDFSIFTDGKVELLIETLSKTPLTSLTATPLQIKRWAESKNLKVALDCTHIASWGISPAEGYEMFGSLIKNIHLNNTYECRVDAHLPPHKGCLDLEELLRRVSKKYFQGDLFFVLEINFHLDSLKEIEKTISDSVAFVKSILK